MRYRKIKIGAICLFPMILIGCSTSEKIPVKQPILCPPAPMCRQITVSMKTNRDLALALAQSLNQTELCVIENNALKQCIADFNQGAEKQK